MEIDPIGAVQGRTIHFGSAEHAQELAVARQTAILEKQGLPVSTESANVTTSSKYSPALYAQAAQYQLFSQSGTLAALLAQHGLTAPADTSIHDHPDEIKAVEGAHGTIVDTKV